MEIAIQNNFNKMLLEMISEDDNNQDNLCLIDGTPLEPDHITLCCSHKFNYSNLFEEVKKQKLKKNHYETQYLRSYQIKCPYCRTTQNGILPFKEGFDKIKYVNSPEKYVIKNNKCSYIFKSGKRKGLPCNKPCFYDCCTTHLKIKNKTKTKDKNKNNSNNKCKPPDIPPNDRCKHLLTSGKNKGYFCGCKLKQQYLQYGFCGNHYKKYI